jgi:hypothetical protein
VTKQSVPTPIDMTPPLPKRQPPQPAAAAGTLFVVATVAKAVEPLAVGHSSRHGATQPEGQEFSIGCAVVLVEVLKLVVCGAALLCQLRCTSAEHRGALVEVSAAITLCNALPRARPRSHLAGPRRPVLDFDGAQVDHKQLMRLAIPGLLLALTNWGGCAPTFRLCVLLAELPCLLRDERLRARAPCERELLESTRLSTDGAP